MQGKNRHKKCRCRWAPPEKALHRQFYNMNTAVNTNRSISAGKSLTMDSWSAPVTENSGRKNSERAALPLLNEQQAITWLPSCTRAAATRPTRPLRIPIGHLLHPCAVSLRNVFLAKIMAIRVSPGACQKFPSNLKLNRFLHSVISLARISKVRSKDSFDCSTVIAIKISPRQ